MATRFIAIAVGLLFAFVGVQGPEFAQQYRQRLAGAVDELTRVVASFDAEAARESLAPETAMAKLEANADALARERGVAADEEHARLVRLNRALAAMKDAPQGARLLVLVENFDADVAEHTLADYEPAAPTTMEAAVLAAVFGLWGWGGTHLCAWPIRRRIARRRETVGRIVPEERA